MVFSPMVNNANKYSKPTKHKKQKKQGIIFTKGKGKSRASASY